ncbi:Monocarboxylate transporter 12 [Armadillidium vulgare]|nr:Monocarboxylate transporter 12 [Armadillidium vulgare]
MFGKEKLQSVERPESSSVCNDETLKPLQNLSNSKPNSNVEKVPPDGGWGWMIVIGGIIIVTLGTFPSFAFSYLFSPILKSQGVSSFIIAWIYNLRNLTGSICSLFIGPLCDEFGYRKTALLGGLTIFVSMILSAFATSPNLLFLSYALLEGIGSRVLIIPTLIVSKYFQKRRGLATGLTSLLSSGHSIIAPLVPTYLLRYYDYKGSSLICAAIVLNQCVGAMLFQPVEWHMKLIKGEQLTEKILNEENKSEYRYSEDKIDLEAINIIPEENNFKMDNNSYCFNCCKIQSKSRKPISHIKLMANKINNKANHKNIKHTGTFIRVLKATYEILKSLKNIRVQIIALAYCGFILGYLNFQVWIPFIITDAGYSLESAAWCSSLSTIVTVICLDYS